jgi:excisionase family DNA binding protein
MTTEEAPAATWSVEQAARVLGVSRAKAYQLVRTAQIPVVRVGVRSTRVPRAALAAWIERNTEGQGA